MVRGFGRSTSLVITTAITNTTIGTVGDVDKLDIIEMCFA